MNKQLLVQGLIKALKEQDWVEVASVSLKLNTLQEEAQILEFENHYNQERIEHESEIQVGTDSEKAYGKLIELGRAQSKGTR